MLEVVTHCKEAVIIVEEGRKETSVDKEKTAPPNTTWSAELDRGEEMDPMDTFLRKKRPPLGRGIEDLSFEFKAICHSESLRKF